MNNTQGCSRFDASPSSCEGAFVMGEDGAKDSCFYDSDANECRPCDANAQGDQECLNTCPVCAHDTGRTIFLGGPFSSACHNFDNSPSLCEQAFHLSPECGTLSSCWYDFDNNECRGCGFQNQVDGLCQNSCAVPECGDGAVNQSGEECDLDDIDTCVLLQPELQLAVSVRVAERRVPERIAAILLPEDADHGALREPLTSGRVPAPGAA
jgi:hypothetical protein